MKILKYIPALLAVFMFSCEKSALEYDGAKPLTGEAEFQLHLQTPVANTSANYMYQIDLDGQMIANSAAPLQTYNAIPTTASRFFTSKPGAVNLKMYQGTDLKPAYDKTVTLVSGKQNVVVYDLTKDPVVFDNEFPYPYPNDHTSYDTDTLGYVKFYNFMYDAANAPTTLKLQYQYQYILHPIYTLEDEAKNQIPAGKKVGDATNETTRSAWLNLGASLSFGETTGWQRVPVKKSTYVSQGAANIYYRIVVTAGGEEGVNMKDGILLTGASNAAYNDYWALTVGRRVHHFFGGVRNNATIAVRQYWAL